jgi:hypothetical protein
MVCFNFVFLKGGSSHELIYHIPIENWSLSSACYSNVENPNCIVNIYIFIWYVWFEIQLVTFKHNTCERIGELFMTVTLPTAFPWFYSEKNGWNLNSLNFLYTIQAHMLIKNCSLTIFNLSNNKIKLNLTCNLFCIVMSIKLLHIFQWKWAAMKSRPHAHCQLIPRNIHQLYYKMRLEL